MSNAALPEPAAPRDTATALDVGRLRLLREVGLRGSIAAAARTVGITPSAVSQQLSALEREAGTSLIDRSPRGVLLTGAGQALSARAAEVIDVLDAARADLERLSGAIAGGVRIAAVASAAATFVCDAASTLHARHPELAISVLAAEPERALGNLLDGDVDLAVVDEYDYVPLALPDYVTAVELGAEPLVAVAAPGALARGLVGLGDLADADWVIPPREAACGQAVRSACRASGFEPRVRWETDDLLLLRRAIAAGHGLSVLPRLSVRIDPAAGPEVAVHRLRAPQLSRRLFLVARASVLARPAVAEVLGALRAAYR